MYCSDDRKRPKKKYIRREKIGFKLGVKERTSAHGDAAVTFGSGPRTDKTDKGESIRRTVN